MCVIIYKPRGIKADSVFYSNINKALSNNRSGAGFIIRSDKKISMIKTYEDVNSLNKTLEQTYDRLNLGEDPEIMFHARIATCGSVRNKNSHPFFANINGCFDSVLKYEDTLDNFIENKGCFFIHNGGFYNYCRSENNEDNVDSFNFFKKQVWVNSDNYDIFYANPEKYLKNLKEDFLSTKTMFMYGESSLLLNGNFLIDNNKTIASNSSGLVTSTYSMFKANILDLDHQFEEYYMTLINNITYRAISSNNNIVLNNTLLLENKESFKFTCDYKVKTKEVIKDNKLNASVGKVIVGEITGNKGWVKPKLNAEGNVEFFKNNKIKTPTINDLSTDASFRFLRESSNALSTSFNFKSSLSKNNYFSIIFKSLLKIYCKEDLSLIRKESRDFLFRVTAKNISEGKIATKINDNAFFADNKYNLISIYDYTKIDNQTLDKGYFDVDYVTCQYENSFSGGTTVMSSKVVFDNIDSNNYYALVYADLHALIEASYF